GGRGDEQADAIARAGVLAETVRRRLFGFVRRARRPVTRDEAAAWARVSRGLAAFHLDRLVEAGLLRAGGRAATSRRVGRRPKLYEAGPGDVRLSIPERRHDLLAGVLLEALLDEE